MSSSVFFLYNPNQTKKNFKIRKLIITFEKYLINNNRIHRKGQSVIEYTLLLVVIASLMLAFFVDDFAPIKMLFNNTVEDLIDRTLQ